jgi:hypothetical protein
MVDEKEIKRKRCKKCNKIIDSIWFTALMTEEWSWNGEDYNECTAKHTLLADPESNVECPNCGNVIGIGKDFGFGIR